MKIYLYGLLLLAVIPSLYSQHSLQGKITDAASQEVLFSANIYLPQIEKGSMSDLDGNFIIQNIPEGNYRLLVSILGYETYSTTVRIPSEDLNISLKPTAMEMEEIIVSTPFHQLQSENVMKVERESVSELNKRGAITLADGISQIAGVESVTTGIGIGKPVIRGLSSNRVLVYTQGVRMENQQYGDEHGLGISSKGIESVEVIKGPASLLYGSDAIGGVLYLNPENYASVNSFDAGFESDYYSNTLGHQSSLVAKTSGEFWKFLARGSYAAHSDYETGAEYRVTNTRFKEKDLKAGIGYQKNNYKADLRYNYNNNKVGIPEEIGEQSLSKNPNLPYQDLQNHILSLENRLYLGEAEINLKLGYQFNNRKEFEDHHHEEDHDGDHEHEEDEDHDEHEEEEHHSEELESPALEMHLETFNYNLRYNFPVKAKFQTIVGTQGMFQTNANLGEEILIPDARTVDFGAFITSHYHVQKWDFQGGLRYDIRNVDTEEFSTEENEVISAIDKNYNAFNAALGAKYQFEQGFNVRLNLASGFRAPNLSELTSNGNHNGANRYEIGNADLTNEQNLQIDLALEYRNEHFEAFVNGFHNTVNDYIFIAPNGEMIDNENVYSYVQNNAKLYGGEAGIHIHPHPLDWLHVESSFETVTGKLDNGNYLPLIPANTLTNTLRIEFAQGDVLKDKYAFVRLQNTMDQDHPGNFETRTGGYSLLSSGFGTRINLPTGSVAINLSANNLLNKDYTSHLSRLKPDGIFNIGRNFQISFNWEI